MSGEFSDAHGRWILVGSATGGLAIAGGAFLAASMVDRAAALLTSLAWPYVGAIAALSVLFWAVRAARDGEPGRTPKPPRPVLIAYAVYTLAFLVAALILSIAAFVAWLFGAELAAPLLQAFLLTLLGLVAVRICSDCFVSLFYLVRKRNGNAAAP